MKANEFTRLLKYKRENVVVTDMTEVKKNMTARKKISKSDPIAKELASRTVTVEVYGARTTKGKDGSKANNPKVVFELAGARDKANAAKASYPIVLIYGFDTKNEEGDILEVTIRPKPKEPETAS